MAIKAKITVNDRRGAANAEVLDTMDRRLGDFAGRVAELAKQNAPRKTGDLADSIEVFRDAELGYRVETGVGYGAHVELGTSRQAAQPFLGPAGAQATGEAQELLGEANGRA